MHANTFIGSIAGVVAGVALMMLSACAPAAKTMTLGAAEPGVSVPVAEISHPAGGGEGGDIRWFAATENGAKPESAVLEMRITSAVDAEGQWRVSTLRHTSPAQPFAVQRELVLKKSDSGGVSLVELIDHLENKSTLFRPALELYPAALTGGVAFSSTAKFEVRDMKREMKVIDQGDATSHAALGQVSAREIEVESSIIMTTRFATITQSRVQRIGRMGVAGVGVEKSAGTLEEDESLQVKAGPIRIVNRRTHRMVVEGVIPAGT